jgi:pilus assembly protein FimV
VAVARASAVTPAVEPEPEPENVASPEEEALLEDPLDLDDSGLELLALDHADYVGEAGEDNELELALDDEALVEFSADSGTDELELELELEDLADSTEELSLELEESSEQEESEDVLDLGDEFSMLDSDPLQQVETQAAAQDSDSGELSLDDFEIEGLTLESESAAETLAEPATEDSLEVGLDLELESVTENDSDTLLEFGDLELDDNSGDELNLETVTEEMDDSEADALDLDLDAEDEEEEEGLVFATDGDEIATKLDLARAYLDMGDHDGARSILEEVQQDGNEGQQQEAQTLLDGID